MARPSVLLACASVLVCATVLAKVHAWGAPAELESSDMREIDLMLNRIHKLTKHDYNGKREPTGHAKLAETERHHHKASPAPATHRPPQAAGEVRKEEPELTKVHEKPKVRKATTEPAPGHDAKSRRKRMALHRLAHKAHVQHAAHKHQNKPENKALEQAMQAENAALHSGLPKKKSTISPAKQKKIEDKMKRLQAQISKDFASVTHFGKKAGYLPPVKLPHL